MRPERVRLRPAALAALAAGLLLRLWFVRHAPLVSGDTLVYGGIAKNWMTYGIYGFYGDGRGSIDPTLIRLPGYPMFLAACFRIFGMDHYGAVRYVQVAADLLTCWLAGAVARTQFGVRAGLIALWLAALCPFTANYVAVPLTETLVLLTIAAAFYGFVRWQQDGKGFNRWLWLTGGSLGYSVLLRPDESLLTVAVLGAMAWTAFSRDGSTRRALLPIAACALCGTLPLAPWTLRNWRTFHVLQPLAPKYANDPGEAPPLAFARWYRSWAFEFASTDQVYWNYNGDAVEARLLPDRAYAARSPGATEALRDRTLEVLSRYNTTRLQTTESESGFAVLASERIQAHPFEYYLVLPVARLADMVFRPRTELMAIPLEWWRWRQHPRLSLIAAIYAGLDLVYMAIGLFGFLRWRGYAADSSQRSLPALAWAMAASVVLRSALLLTIDNSEPRYTLEFFPVIFICAAALFTKPQGIMRHDGDTAHN